MAKKADKNILLKDVDTIIKRLKESHTTLKRLMQEYKCGYYLLRSIILTKISEDQFQQIAFKKQNNNVGRFTKGFIPWNKGKKIILPAACKATQFKKGILRGQAARNWRPVGTISFRCDHGRKTKKRRFIKIKDEKPSHKNWIPYSRYIWQKHFGPVPEGFFVGHKDGKLLNDNVNNLILLDCRSNLNRLETIRPGSKALARKRIIKSNKKRFEVYRKLKSSIGVIIQWECPQCGASYEEKPEQCIKCGCLYLEKIRINTSIEHRASRACPERSRTGSLTIS